MKTEKIRHHDKLNPPRNKHRVTLEVDVVSQNGTVVGTHRAKPGLSRVEVYADELEGIADKVQTQAHYEAYARAKTLADYHREEWLKANGKAKRGKSSAEWDEYVYWHCNVRPEQYLPMSGAPKGMPPIKSAKVVALDGETLVPLSDFLAMNDQERIPFLGAPPATIEGAQLAQSTALEQLAAAFASAQGNGRRK